MIPVYAVVAVAVAWLIAKSQQTAREPELPAPRRLPPAAKLPSAASRNPLDAAGGGWTAERAELVELSADRQYCALIVLTGLSATFGSADDVAKELGALVQWRALWVIPAWPATQLERVPIDLPLTRAAGKARFYALGQPLESKPGIRRPSEITELYSRPAPP